jgi:putative transposase
VTAAYPHHGWGIDIPDIRLRGAWLSLEAVLDGVPRQVGKREPSESRSLPWVLAAAERALAPALPALGNQDQGSPFTSPQSATLWEQADVQISREGRVRALDHIYTERVGRSLTSEEGYLKDYRRPREARQGMEGCVVFYNTVRPHPALGYRPPSMPFRPGLSR